MTFRDALLQALRHLRAHKVRALLTLFGLVWGTASVIFLVAWGEGVTVMLERGFMRTGKNLGHFQGALGFDRNRPAGDGFSERCGTVLYEGAAPQPHRVLAP